MNLQENIERIHEIMGGVITENKMDKVIKNMIDDIGIENTFKMVGDYDLMEKYFTDEDKINYIKDQFHKINDGNYFSLDQILQRPIQLEILEDGVKQIQIEGLSENHVSVVKYKFTGPPMKYYSKYEVLSSETIDKLFRMMLGQYI
jgi:hypothetical protein